VDQPLSSEPVAKRRRLELRDEMLDRALPEMERDTCSGKLKAPFLAINMK